MRDSSWASAEGIREAKRAFNRTGLTQPIRLIDIYTNVNLLEPITGDRALKMTQLIQGEDASRVIKQI